MSDPLPIDTSCEAEYQDGFVLSETATGDTTQWPHLIPVDQHGEAVEGNNTFADILHHRPEREHGRMVRFSVFYKHARHDIDWRGLPLNARPIRYRDASATRMPDGSSVFNGYHAVRFGYQYNDETGRNIKQVKELK